MTIFTDQLRNEYISMKQIKYIVYLQMPYGVVGYECDEKIKICDHCNLIKRCFPMMIDPLIESENAPNERTETKYQRLEK